MSDTQVLRKRPFVDSYRPSGRAVTLCGSTRYMAAFHRLNVLLTLEGAIVYSVAAVSSGALTEGQALGLEAKATLDAVHRRKIERSDEILVLDVDRYIGESTQREIEHARLLGRGVAYLSEVAPALFSELSAIPAGPREPAP